MRLFSTLGILIFALAVTAFAAPLGKGIKAPKIDAVMWIRDGKKVEALSEKDLRGKVIVLEFWAYWCSPCAESIQKMVKIHKKFEKDKRVLFIGATDEGTKTLARTRRFLKKYKVPWINAIGTKCSSRYLVDGVPTTFVIDGDGKISWHDGMGGAIDKAITASLEKLPPVKKEEAKKKPG